MSKFKCCCGDEFDTVQEMKLHKGAYCIDSLHLPRRKNKWGV